MPLFKITRAVPALTAMPVEEFEKIKAGEEIKLALVCAASKFLICPRRRATLPAGETE